ERALEAAFGLEQEGRASPSLASVRRGGGGLGGGGADGREVGSPRGSGSSGGARTMAEALRSPSKKPSSTEVTEAAAAAAAAASGGKQGRTKGIVGGVLAVKDAEVSRCVRFGGRGWAVARRPNLTVQALDVFLLEALIRPAARESQRQPKTAEPGGQGATACSEEEEGHESVVLSQGGQAGFCLAVRGTTAVLRLHGKDAGEQARHATPDGALPAEGTWFKLSAAVARDSSPGMDKVVFYVDGTAVHKSNLPSPGGRRTPVSQSPQQQRQQQSGPILIGGRQSEVAVADSPRNADVADAAAAEPAATPESSGAPPIGAATTNQDGSVTGLFTGEVAQVRVWSSPSSESSLQRTVGRSAVLEADAT
ncbi:unnamed protein product, partial [Ectocarpus sp. 12 AP-2014]